MQFNVDVYQIILSLLYRLDDIVKTKDDSDYSRLSHYNTGLRLLKETLESEKLQHRGKHNVALGDYICSAAADYM